MIVIENIVYLFSIWKINSRVKTNIYPKEYKTINISFQLICLINKIIRKEGK